MGKAKIVSGGDDGNYTIKLDYGVDVRDERVEKLAERLQEMAPKIDEAKAKLQAAKDKEVAAKVAAEQATAVYVAATQAIPLAFAAVSAAGNALASISKSSTATAAEITAAKVALAGAEAAYKAAQEDAKTKMAAQVTAAKELVEAKKKTAPLQLALDLLTDERKQVEKDKAYYAGLTLDETLQAWCADLTEDAEGEVATIEIPGENRLVLIKAGAPKAGAADGALIAREMQSPEQVFWCAAVLPGWQKWMPTFRVGTITAIDAKEDEADVVLSADYVSSAQNLPINQADILEAVPVEYMTCNASAFEVGDMCVVQFDGQEWDAPKVVGFFDSPRPCGSGIGISYVTPEGQENIIITPSGAFRSPTGNWRARSEKVLLGGRYPWSSDTRGEYAVSTGTSGRGFKYNGVVATNDAVDSVQLTFGGEAADSDGVMCPYIAQIATGNNGFILSVAKLPKRLRSMRSYGAHEQEKAFEIDSIWHSFDLYKFADVSRCGRYILCVKRELEFPSSYPSAVPALYQIFYNNVHVGITGQLQKISKPQDNIIRAEVPAGRPGEAENGRYCASKNLYAVLVSSSGPGTRTWERRLDIEFPGAIDGDEKMGAYFIDGDGAKIGQDMLQLIHQRDGRYEYISTGKDAMIAPEPGDVSTGDGSEWHSLTEKLSCKVGEVLFDLYSREIRDSGEYIFNSVITKIENDTNYYYSTARKSWALEADVTNRSIIFYDRQLSVLVYIEVKCIASHSSGWSSIRVGDPHSETIVNPSPEVSLVENNAEIVVWHHGAEIYKKKIDAEVLVNRRYNPETGESYTFINGFNFDDGAFIGDGGTSIVNEYGTNRLGGMFSVAYQDGESLDYELQSAKDPFTGALVMHLDIKDDGFGGVDAEWFVFDGGSAKSISQVSNIPEDVTPTRLMSI